MILENILSVRYEILIAVSFTVLLRIIFSLLKSSQRNIPPGPWGLPIFGYIPFLSRTKSAHLHITNLAKKYGDIFSLRLGTELVVVLNDAESIKAAYNKQELLGRPPHNCFSVFGWKKPFRANDLHMWQEHRRFVIQSLKYRSKLEVIVQDELGQFRDVLKTFKGQPIDLAAVLTPSLSNNMSAFIFGKRYDYNEPERNILDNNLEKISKILTKDDTLTYFPWIRHIPFLLKRLGYEKTYKIYTKSEEIFKKRKEEHKKTLDEKNIRDFIDSYLVEMEQKQKKGVKTSLMDEAMFAVVSGLYTAGDESMRSTIRWTMYTMASFLDVQKKVQEDILQNIGQERIPEFQDMKSMPYSYAVLLEIMRFNTVAALNVLRYTLADTKIAGYDLPEGTLVMANFWAVHHDPRNWEDPDKFKPERFLSPDGKTVVKSPHYMTFSIGKRSCPGEELATMEIFLYFLSILQKFDVRFPEGYVPTFDGIFTSSYKPPPAKIRFIPKN
ncbi:unnamed protein product [Larinioides sclopetarius]|uniref:Cytochrome P450 n=1 Tax=Larinioides sclopetarius TaxID=280406 RepID=A0AAV1ZMM0_9ARAC